MKTKIEPVLTLDITKKEAEELLLVLQSGASMEINAYEGGEREDFLVINEMIQVLESFLLKV